MKFYIRKGYRYRGLHGNLRLSDMSTGCRTAQGKNQEVAGQHAHSYKDSMRATLGHRIALDPTKKQEVFFRKCVGVARFAYNWALAEWKRQYEVGEKPSWVKLNKQLNAIKREQFPWMLEVPKGVPQSSIINLGVAFARFFSKRARYPKFKKRSKHDSARLALGVADFSLRNYAVRLPKIGWVRTFERLRFRGRPLSAVLSRTADRWFVSVTVEMDWEVPQRENQASVGIDLGIHTTVTLSNGQKFNGPKPLVKCAKKLKRLNKNHSRKVKGSRNRQKAGTRLARLHARFTNTRKDWLHKLTRRLCSEFSLIGIEDLDILSMLMDRKFSSHIQDIGLYEFRRQLEYKSKLYGIELVIADRNFPSTELCFSCIHRESLSLKKRSWTCPLCGSKNDRDVNAAKNLEWYAIQQVHQDGLGHGREV